MYTNENVAIDLCTILYAWFYDEVCSTKVRDHSLEIQTGALRWDTGQFWDVSSPGVNIDLSHPTTCDCITTDGYLNTMCKQGFSPVEDAAPGRCDLNT